MEEKRIEEGSQSRDEVIKEFLTKYDGRLPNPEQYPKQFAFLLKSFLVSKGLLD